MLKSLLDKIRTLSGNGEELALATIVKVEGSAYLREGAKMIFTRSGQSYGMLSAGCLEDDLLLKLEEVFASGEPQIYTYNTNSNDDLLWGTGSGCNGTIDIFVELVSWNEQSMQANKPSLSLLADLIYQQRHTVAVAKCISGKIPSAIVLFDTDSGQLYDGLNGCAPIKEIEKAVADFLLSGDSFHIMELPEWNATFFIELYMPEDRLFVFGAGADAVPLIEMAGRLGFRITLIDPRSSRCNSELFPSAEDYVVAHPEEAFRKIDIGDKDYVLVMTHNFLRDQEIASELLTIKPYYVGILGPRRRTLQLLTTDSLPEFIHSPMGLSIGAKGPEEISVSIMAEMIEARRKNRKRGESTGKY